MNSDIFISIQQFLQNNQLLGTVAGGSLVVWLVSNLKNIYYVLKKWIVDCISFSIVNKYEITQFGSIPTTRQVMFNDIIYSAKSIWERTVNIDCVEHYDQTNEVSKHKVCRKDTYGQSVKLIFGKLCVVNRSYENNNMHNNIITVVRVYFASKKRFLDRLNSEIYNRLEAYTKQQCERKHVVVFAGDNEFIKYRRSINSIFTNNNEHEQALENIRKFLKNRDIYRSLNYPYKYCCCLHGKPGCGKSSTILAIASELNRDIRYINLATVSIGQLIYQLSINQANVIYVFEDIDAINGDATTTRVVSDETTNTEAPTNQICNVNLDADIKVHTLSLSDLLNVTDGLLSNDGTICIFTTNHIERLDPAFLRAGRMNDIIEFDYLNAETANKMIKTHLGYTVDNLKPTDIRPAELQEMILNIKTGHATKEQLIEKFCL